MSQGRTLPHSGRTGGAGGTALLNQAPGPVGMAPLNTAPAPSFARAVMMRCAVALPSCSPADTLKRVSADQAGLARSLRAMLSRIDTSCGNEAFNTTADAPTAAA